MVGHVVSSSSCIHLGMMPKVHFTKRSCLYRNPPVHIPQRKPVGSCNITWKPSGEARRRCVSTSLNLGAYLSSRGECTCLASLADFDAVAGSGWVPIGDQVLLMASVFLTYMAGVIPLQNNSGYSSSRKNTVEEENPDLGTTSESFGGETGFDGDLESVWDVVKGKILDSLDAIKRESTLGSRVLKPKPPQGKPPLSLYAISERPQLYLLWSCFQKLEEETNKIPNTVNSDEWMVCFNVIVSEAYQGACAAWLKSDSDKAMTPLLIKMLNEKDAVIDKIRKSGKGDLFAEFLYFHRFGSSRKPSCYDLSLFRTHGVAILEDLMITLADGVASIYLELISVDSKFSDEMNSGGLDICNLSSRALQKLRNEVALYQWLHQNMEAVVSMYEDRFDLYILQTQVINNPDDGADTESQRWWRKLTPGKAKAASSSSSLRYSVISDFSLPVKRTKELKALSGWRYYFSLFLELSDIGMPIIRVVVDKVSSIISFFLVTLIGRSVGLIFTGIRQSLRWK
ncbi:Phosphoglycolate phosphatase [Hirschfeldia incana]|nr:Phosphoglycolate phosphatase [Hirschfeldia incana]